MLNLTKNIYRSLSNVDLRRDETVPVSEAIKEQVFKWTAVMKASMRSRDDLNRLNNLRQRSYHWLSHPFRSGDERVEVGYEEEDQEEDDKEGEKE